MAPVSVQEEYRSPSTADTPTMFPSSQIFPNSRPDVSTSVATYGHRKNVCIGKDQHPVSILSLVATDSPTWQKAACFNELSDTAKNLSDSAYSVADILSFLSDELPSNTSAAYQESTRVTCNILACVYNVSLLNPTSCFISKGNTVSLVNMHDLDKGAEGIAFF